MRRWLIIGVAFAALLVYMGFQQNSIEALKRECSRNKTNVALLMGDVEQYRTRDSLSAAQIQSLQLTVKEYERFRAEDAELIRTLQVSKRDLQSVVTSQSRTIIELSSTPKDTIIIRDSIAMPAIAVHAGDAWFDFDGLLTEKEFTGTLSNRDSLLVAETVRYKRFLGFLWKTKYIRDRQIDVVSRNPHTTIAGCEHVTIEK